MPTERSEGGTRGGCWGDPSPHILHKNKPNELASEAHNLGVYDQEERANELANEL